MAIIAGVTVGIAALTIIAVVIVKFIKGASQVSGLMP